MSRLRPIDWFVLSAVMACCVFGSMMFDAVAGPSAKGVGYQQVPAPGDGDRTLYASANTPGPLTWDSNGATAGGLLNICVPFDSMVVLKAKGGEWLGTFSMDPSVGQPIAVDASGACYVTDPDVAAASGRGSCITVADGERLYAAVDFNAVYARPGARNTLCSLQVRGLGDRLVYPPCSATADCTAVGAGTCVTGTARTQAELRQLSCAYAVGQVDTNNSSLTISEAR